MEDYKSKDSFLKFTEIVFEHLRGAAKKDPQLNELFGNPLNNKPRETYIKAEVLIPMISWRDLSATKEAIEYSNDLEADFKARDQIIQPYLDEYAKALQADSKPKDMLKQYYSDLKNRAEGNFAQFLDWSGKLQTPFYLLLRKKGSLFPTREDLTESYLEFIKLFQDFEIEGHAIVPLLNINFSSLPIKLDKIVKIERFTEEEKNEKWDKLDFLPHYMGLDQFSFDSCQNKISIQIKENKKVLDPSNYIETARSVLTALRLTKPGNFGGWGFFTEIDSPLVLSGRSFGQYFNSRARLDFISTKLSEDEMKRFIDVYSKIAQLRKDGAYKDIELALRRFNQSYDRDFLEDKLIDLTIALECCLLPGTRDELKYRLSLRGSALVADFLGKDICEVSDLFKKIYDTRSKIIHEGKILEGHEKELVLNCEELVRAVLYLLIEEMTSGASFREVIDSVDLRILKNSLKNN